MIVYTILLLLVIILSATKNRKDVESKTIFVGFALFLLMALKDYSVGTDTIRYLERYELTNQSMDRMDEYEPGFYYLIRFCKFWGMDYRLFSALCYLIIYSLTTLFIIKFSERPIYSYLLFITIGIFGFSISGLRQALAVSICYLAVYLLFYKKDFIFSTILFYLSGTIHFSARIGFLYLIIYLIASIVKNINKKLVALLMILPVIALIFNTSIINQLIILDQSIRYEAYYDDDHKVNIVSYFIIPYLMFLYASYSYINSNKSKDSFEQKKFAFLYICSLIYAITAGISIAMPMTSRFLFYFSLPTLVFITNSIERQKFRFNAKRFQYIVVLIVCVMYFYISFSNNIMMISNYKFFFQNN